MPVIAKCANGGGRTMSVELRDQLVMDYAHFVTFIAGRIASRLPESVSIDDLVSAGFLGLLDAIEKFDQGRDNKFKTYAEHRIRGSILDELRKWDSVSRSTRDKEKCLGAARLSLTQQLGREPTSLEIAYQLDMTLDQYHAYRSSADTPGNALEFDDQLEQREGLIDPHCLPFEALRQREVRQALVQAIEQLPEREKTILGLYYYEDLSLKEIGQVLAITESRVCQIHRRALKRLGFQIKAAPDLSHTA